MWSALAPSFRPVGRNEPCPCGSGRKYKQCCLRRDEAFLHMRAGCDGLNGLVMRAMRLEEVAPAVDRAWTRFWPEPPERDWSATLAALEGDSRLIETLDVMPFVDWVMHDAPLEGVPAEVPLRRADDARPGDSPTLLDIFAGASPEEEIAPDKPAAQLLEAWRRSVPGVFEVVRTDPGRSAWVRDLFTEESFEVRDAAFSREARPGNVALMRLRPLAGLYEITGDPWAYAATEVPALRAFGEEHLTRLREVEPDADWRRLWKVRGELMHHYVVTRRRGVPLPHLLTTRPATR